MDFIDIVVETPQKSTHKYTFDPETKSFSHSKTLPLGMSFPFDFGFIPGTKGEDGDPLDVIIISENGTFTGCKIKGRIIGCIRAKQKEQGKAAVENDRYLAIPGHAQLLRMFSLISSFPKP